LVFLASLAFNALTPENPSIGEADARWILITAAAALVSAVGAGVVVRRAQLHDGYQRWMESEQITSIGRQLAALEAAGGQPLGRGRGTRRVTWLLVGLAVVVGASRVNRRLS